MIRRGRKLIAVFLLALVCAPVAARATTVEVKITGLDEELLGNVRLLLGIEQNRGEPGLTDGRIRALHARAPAEIRRALEPFGYYRAGVRAELVAVNGRWLARYVVEPGPPLPVAELDLRLDGDAREDEEFQELLATFPVRLGERLQHAGYEDGKRALLSLAAERGYFDARLVRHEVRVDLERYQAEVALHLDSGPRYRFGPVRFEQEFFDPEFLERFTTFRPGEPYRNSALLQLQTALTDTDYFQQVEVQPHRELAADHEVPITVRLVLRPPNKYTFGVGYGTDTGMRGKLGWERRLINPGGHRFGAAVDLSEIRTTLSARYRIPVLDPRTDEIVVSTAYTDDHPQASTSEIITFGVGLRHRRGAWRETLSATYHREDYTAGEDEGRTSLFMPGATWERVWGQERLHAHRGSRWQLDLRGASTDLASDVTFWQARLAGKTIVPAGTGRFIVRTEGGYTRVDQFEDLPATLRFYAGGSQNVRGYAYQSLGPVGATGEVIGGHHLAFGSLEYEHRLFGAWSAAVFYDAGKAFSDAGEPWSEGAGAGVRWRTPIGLLRIDVASALSRAGDPWRLHVTIGPDL